MALDDLQPPTPGFLNPKFKIQDPGKPREGEKVLLIPQDKARFANKALHGEQGLSGSGIVTKAAEMASAIPELSIE